MTFGSDGTCAVTIGGSTKTVSEITILSAYREGSGSVVALPYAYGTLSSAVWYIKLCDTTNMAAHSGNMTLTIAYIER